jgi:hypothetical protein
VYRVGRLAWRPVSARCDFMVQALRTSLRYGGLRQGGLQPGLGGDSIFATSSLDLNFAKHKNLGTIVDATTGAQLVTFTRASSGTYVDSEGVIRTAVTNLLLRSEEFDNASWGGGASGNATVTPNAIAAPFGSITADLLDDTSTTQVQARSQVINIVSSTGSYTLSAFVRPNTSSIVSLRLGLGGATATNGEVVVDLATGAAQWRSGTNVATSFAITSAGGDWYRISVTVTDNGTGNNAATIELRPAFALTYTDTLNVTAQGSAYFWGAQVEQSATVGEYIPTTSTINSAPRFDHDPTTGESLGLLVEEQRTNLLLYSACDSNWPTGGFGTPTYNLDLSALGVFSGVQVASLGQNWHSIYRAGISLTASTVYAFTLFYRAGTSGRVRLTLRNNTTSTETIVNGVAGNLSVSAAFAGAATILSQYLCSDGLTYVVTGTFTPNGTSANHWYRIGPDSTTSGQTVIALGGQLEVGAFPTSYIPTTGATATRAADVASISGSNFGVSRTNLLLRSEEFETGWNLTNILAFGSGSTVNAIASPNGSVTADKVTEDTATGFHRIGQQFSHIAGVTYTFTVFVKAAERTKIHLQLSANLFKIALFDLATGTTANPDATIINYGNDWYRCSLTSTATTTTSATALVEIADDSGNRQYAGDGTSGLYLWGAQLETGSTATAYIPTTTAAVTVVESPWYRQDEGTLFADARTQQSATGHILAGVSTGSFASSAYLSKASDNFLKASPDAAPSSLNISLQSVSSNVGLRAALAFTAGTGSASATMNGGTVGTDASTGIPITMSQIGIGTAPWSTGTTLWNGHIARLTYWPARLSDSTLQTITQ